MKPHENCPMDSYVQSLDRSIDTLRLTLHDDMGTIHSKLDELGKTTIKKGDCEKCRGELRVLASDKLDKTTFAVVWKTVLAVGGLFGVVTAYLAATGGLVKAFGGP